MTDRRSFFKQLIASLGLLVFPVAEKLTADVTTTGKDSPGTNGKQSIVTLDKYWFPDIPKYYLGIDPAKPDNGTMFKRTYQFTNDGMKCITEVVK